MYVEGQRSFDVGGGTVADQQVSSSESEYYHDYTTGDFFYPDGRQMVEVGPERTVLVRMSDIHELPQIREKITQKDVEDLAFKIIKDSQQLREAQTPQQVTDALELMHPPGLILLQPVELETFLSQHADFYELDEPFYIPHGGRPVILRNEGHRRGRAIEHIVVKMKGLTKEDVGIRSTLHFGMSFRDANRRQAKENSHVQTSALEDAKNIIRQYKFIRRNEGRRPSIAEIADMYGFSDTKVRSALAFDSLPEEVQKMAGNEKAEEQLPYSLIADLAPLRDLYDRRYAERMMEDPDNYPLENRDEKVQEEIIAFTYKLAADKKVDKSLQKVLSKLNGEKTSVEEGLTIPIDQFMLFDAKRVDPTVRLNASARRFGANCLYGIEIAAKRGVLDMEMIVRLEQLVDLAKSFAVPADPDDQESLF